MYKIKYQDALSICRCSDVQELWMSGRTVFLFPAAVLNFDHIWYASACAAQTLNAVTSSDFLHHRMPALFAMQNRFDSTEVSQRAVFRQHVSGKMKGGECNGRTGKGRKTEVACLLSQNVSIESTENERQIVTLKEIEGQFSCSNIIFWNMNQTEGSF